VRREIERLNADLDVFTLRAFAGVDPRARTCMGRIEQLQEFITKSPNDPFPRYGLALELKNAGRLDEATTAFATLIEKFPDYTPAYLHAGNTLVARGLRAEARAVFERGIEACIRKRDGHARGEIEAALAELQD
jgi:tetratricopeptide (TPR) repeat protein